MKKVVSSAAVLILAVVISGPSALYAGSYEALRAQAPLSGINAPLISRSNFGVTPVSAPSKAYGAYRYSSVNGTLVVEPDDSRTPVVDLINSASRSIDVTIYTISDRGVVNALVAAAKRGVDVRVIYNYNSFAQYNIDPDQKAIDSIVAAGGQAEKASSKFTITHQKTITVDDKTTLIMSFNLSYTYFNKTRDFGYITSNPGIVGEVEKVFNADWNGTSVSPSQPALVWSPENSRSKILGIIDHARKTLEVDNEETHDTQCMNALIAAAKRGVSVRFLTAILTSNSDPTDGNAAERKVLNNDGVQAKGDSALYMHGKMILADYGTSSEKAFLGSENFSWTSLNANRELGILLTNRTALSRLNSVFNSDWRAN